MCQNLLQIENLKTYFYTHFGVAKAVDELDLSLKHVKFSVLSANPAVAKVLAPCQFYA